MGAYARGELMGWETLVIAGASAFNAYNTNKQGTAQAKAIARQGEQQAQNSADNSVRSIGSLQTSFLQSGLTLEGGPMAVLSQAGVKGQTDISRIAENANAASKNAVSAARTKALEQLSSGATNSSFMSSAGSFATDFGNGFTDSLNNAGTFQTGATPGDMNFVTDTRPISLPWSGA